MLVTGNAATGLPVDGRTDSMNSSRTRRARITLLILAALAAALVVGVTAAGADPTVDSKRAEAQRIRAEVEQIYLRVEQAAEAYNLANIQLAQIDADLSSNARHLVVATKSLGVAQVRVAERLRALYVNGDGEGAVEIILGAKSLDDILTRLDVAQRVGEQDAKVLGDVKQFRREVQARRAKLTQARTKQAELVADKAAQKRYADQQLAESRQLLASVQDEIREMEAEERAPAGAARGAGPCQARRPAHGGPVGVGRRGGRTDGVRVGERRLRPAAVEVHRGRRHRHAVPRRAVRLGWRQPVRLRLLRASIMYVYAQVGVSLPHNAAMQYGYGVPVGYDQLEAGDLVFFHGLGHVGIYIGGDQFIHAPHTGDVVKISTLSLVQRLRRRPPAACRRDAVRSPGARQPVAYGRGCTALRPPPRSGRCTRGASA